MPQIKHSATQRQHHSYLREPQRGRPKRKTRRVILIAVLFFAVFGFGIGYFLGGGSIIALIVGATIGGGNGYVLADQRNGIEEIA